MTNTTEVFYIIQFADHSGQWRDCPHDKYLDRNKALIVLEDYLDVPAGWGEKMRMIERTVVSQITDEVIA